MRNFYLVQQTFFHLQAVFSLVHQTLVMDKIYLLAYEIHVKLTTFDKKHSNKGVYRLRGAGLKITENRGVNKRGGKQVMETDKKGGGRQGREGDTIDMEDGKVWVQGKVVVRVQESDELAPDRLAWSCFPNIALYYFKYLCNNKI